MSADRTLRERFDHALAQAVDGLRAGETACAWLQAEEDDFIRFNHGRVRQAGSVIRATLELRLKQALRITPMAFMCIQKISLHAISVTRRSASSSSAHLISRRQTSPQIQALYAR